VHTDVSFLRALIGFEVEGDADVTAGQRYAAVLVPGPEGADYLPATA
jgi:hypothetical protein